MKKGVVMEVGERHAILLTDSGAFVRLAKRGREFVVGEEVPLPAVRRGLPRRAWYALSSTAAAVFLALFLFSSLPGGGPPIAMTPEDAAGTLKIEGGGTTSPMTDPNDASPNDVVPVAPKTVAYVSIDINPSVELGLDADGKVLQATGRNEDAVLLLEGLELVGSTLEEAVAGVMEAAETKVLSGKQEADIVITSVVVDETAKIEEAELQARVRQEVDRVIREHHAEEAEAFHVTVWSAPKEVLEEAEAAGLSAGKMTFLLKAKANGVQVTAEELQKSSIHDVAKRFEDKKLLDADPAWTKEAIKGLLKSLKSQGKSSDDDDDDDDRNGNGRGSDDDADDDRGEGSDGDVGNVGNKGNNGNQGKNGTQGNNGTKDDKGNQGNAGASGNGDKGNTEGKGKNEGKSKDEGKGKNEGKDDGGGLDLNLDLNLDWWKRDDDSKDDGKDDGKDESRPSSDSKSGRNGDRDENRDDDRDDDRNEDNDRDEKDDRNTSEGGPGREDGSVSPRSEESGDRPEGKKEEKDGNAGKNGKDGDADENGNVSKEEKKEKK